MACCIIFLLHCVNADALWRVVWLLRVRGVSCIVAVRFVLSCVFFCADVMRCAVLCCVVRDVVCCERRVALWSVALCCVESELEMRCDVVW